MSMCGCDRHGCRIGPGDPRHGTANGYTNLDCGCEPCRAANAAEQRKFKRRRVTRTLPDDLHGTDNAYTNWGCRCARCRAGHAAVANARYHRRKDGLTDCAMGLAPKPTRRTVQSTEQ